MGSVVVRNILVLIFLFLSFSSFAETTRKSNWRDIGCSKESMDVRASPNAKKIHLKANLTCPQRARLLGFDKSECDKCSAKADNKSKKNSPKGGGTNGAGTAGAVDGSAEDGALDGDTYGATDGSTGSDTGDDKKNGNNGHGNDPDGNDSSNPGNSNNGDNTDADGSPGNGKGKGTSK